MSETHHPYALGYVEGLIPTRPRQFNEAWPIDMRIAYHSGYTRGVLDFIKEHDIEHHLEGQQ
jgi:hypothetical protein